MPAPRIFPKTTTSGSISRIPRLDNVDNYNDFFHPNVCHVCKKTQLEQLIPCDQCKMIFYCSEVHKRMHWEQHQPFCNLITPDLNTERDRKSISHSAGWVLLRQYFLSDAKKYFPNISPYEMQMITFAKSCYRCHRQVELQHCMTCYSYYYCATCPNESSDEAIVQHSSEAVVQHSSECKELKLCLILNILNFEHKEFALRFSHLMPVNDMESFILNYVRSINVRSIKGNQEFWTDIEYFYSDYASGPLTLYDGMKKAGLLDMLIVEECVIHIISASSVEKKYEQAWELLLHLLRPIKTLIIVLIGVGTHLQGEDSDVQVCTNCVERERKLRVEYCSKDYDWYTTESPSTFRPPNVIVSFETQFDYGQFWWRGKIDVPRRIDCPYFLTASLEIIAEENKLRMEALSIINNIKANYFAPNPFKSLMPCRLLHYKHYVGYRNSYVTIYKTLNPKEVLPKATLLEES